MSKKRMLASFIVMCMLVMSMSSMLVNAAGDTTPTSTITITNNMTETGISLEGRIFSVYKIFGATVGDSHMSYILDEDFNDFFTSKVTSTGDLQLDAENYINGLDAANCIQLAADLITEIGTKEIAAESVGTWTLDTTTASAQITSIDGIAPGYYLVVDNAGIDGVHESANASTAGILVSVPTAGNDGNLTEGATIALKGSKPTIDKQVWHNDKANDKDNTLPTDSAILAGGSWDEVADYQIGDTIAYKIVSTIPTDIIGYKTYNYAIADKLEDGIAFSQGTLKVYTDATLQTELAASNYTATYDGADTFKLDFDMITFKQNNPNVTVLYIYYEGTVTKDAEVADGYEVNGVTLEYSNNPYDVSSKGKDSDDVKSYTFALKVDKVDKNSKPLAGATFALYEKGVAEDTLIKVAATTVDNVYVVDKDATAEADGFILTDENGVFTINGLDDQKTYIIREEKAPIGYVKAKDVEFTISAEYANELLTVISTENADVTVSDNKLSTTIVNNSSVLFPGTGGSGTTNFMICGSVLMLSAALFLVMGRSKKQGRY